MIDGKKGWARQGDETVDLVADLFEVWDTMQGEDLDRLGFLNDKDREFSVLDEIKIQGKPAVGVLVKSKGRRDVRLFFDKSSGLLVKRERWLHGDVTNKGYLEETFFSDYQEKDGLKHYRQISVHLHGKGRWEGKVTELEFFDKLDPKLFAKPKGKGDKKEKLDETFKGEKALKDSRD